MTGKKRQPKVVESPEIEIIEPPEDALDEFAYLFSDYDPESVNVTLARLSPDEWLGQSIRGYLCKLTPGHDEEWIADKYGGGSYQLTKKNRANGHILASRQLRIAGEPKPLTAPVADLQEEGSVPDPMKVNVGGVDIPWTGDLKQVQEFVLFVRAMKSLFPEPPDINSVLLETLLRRNEQPSTIDIVKELKEAAGMFGGGESKGGNMYDLIGKAVEQAGPVLANLTKGPALRAPIRQPVGELTGPAVGALPETVSENGGELAEKADTHTTETQPQAESETMGEKQIIFAVVNQLVKCFRLKPPKEVSAVVGMLDLFIGQEAAVIRSQVKDNYQQFVFDLAEAELETDWSDPECQIGTRDQFSEWCDQVFNSYADPERVVKIV